MTRKHEGLKLSLFVAVIVAGFVPGVVEWYFEALFGPAGVLVAVGSFFAMVWWNDLDRLVPREDA